MPTRTGQMKIGFGLPIAGAWATPENISRFARRAEDLGYNSLWTFQRLLVGVERNPPAHYRSVLDPLHSLTFAAAHTSRIGLGVGLIKFPFVSPTFLAKQAATMDVLSKGRFTLGLGPGIEEEEFVATGALSDRQEERVDEYVAVVRSFFNDEVTAFNGEFYTIPASRMAPKPVQYPRLPILLGGVGPSALRQAARIADGWLSGSATDLTKIAADIALVREAARDSGKDPAAIRVVHRGVVRVGASRAEIDGERTRLTGSVDQIRSDTVWLSEQGIDELFYDLNWDPLIGNPDVSEPEAVARAEEILESLAPNR